MTNVTVKTQFLLLGLSEVREMHLVHAALFLLVYLAALTGNLLIVAITILDRCLHTPMYIFLRHLSVLDLCLISVTVPKSILNALTDCSSISFPACVTQLFLVILFAASEMFILTAMSYDRYIAICRPLRYEVVMNRGACGNMAAASWLTGSLFGVLFSASTFSLSFCGSHVVPQFFCDVPSLLTISCSDNHIAIDVSVAIGSCLGFVCLVSIIVSYASIFSTVLRIPTDSSRSKAFSTCLPHLLVVTVFLTTSAFDHLKLPSDTSQALDVLVSMFYTVVPPALNPLIYSLRNRDVKAALGKLLGEQ
ncbi:olfactory receptor 14A2-like [Tachyglossus aculeatus]|uniref:olfactory receptor 14A2-like n=1 Tax=Tachyglossus aculeatus TaxID=9261 RepID=UPI0018F29E85|nr:olfactory receptor 14A2-like [Tachyglossus aculeatus]XP_038597522.1 olfactory receptor 14A2-like [Tachyglossus aculeatus]